MEAYTDFAQVYDTFMDNTPYERWADFIRGVLKEHGIEDGILLDLGCGTGTMTEIFSAEGYDMIGVDASGEMLNIAMEKRARSGRNILYLQQDMREFELYGTVRAVLCVCDSLNYLLEEEELCETFRLVNNYLDPEGLFIFDFNTVYKYETVIGDATIAENREDCSFIWENYYHEEEQINEYDVTVFVREGVGAERCGVSEAHAGPEECGTREAEAGPEACSGTETGEGLFRRFTETHYQRGYTLPVIRRLVEESGLRFVKALDADTLMEVTERSERIYCIAMEKGKKNCQAGVCGIAAESEDAYE